MNRFDSQQDSMKRRIQDKKVATVKNYHSNSTTGFFAAATPNFHGFPGIEDDLLSSVVPPVTVVLEGRSICQRVNLHKHSSYHSLAKELHQMFVDVSDNGETSQENSNLDLSNAVPGHLIAYEDMEDDLLLAGDLNWKDFVRVAKRIRILPAKANTRNGRQEC